MYGHKKVRRFSLQVSLNSVTLPSTFLLQGGSNLQTYGHRCQREAQGPITSMWTHLILVQFGGLQNVGTIASQSKIKSRFNLCIQYTHALAAERKTRQSLVFLRVHARAYVLKSVQTVCICPSWFTRIQLSISVAPLIKNLPTSCAVVARSHLGYLNCASFHDSVLLLFLLF